MINAKTIYTRKGEKIYVSPEDYDDLNAFNWYLNAGGYAVRVVTLCSRKEARETGQKRLGCEFMHRRILNKRLGARLQSEQHVDHVDRNRINNVFENLRIVSARGFENASNQGLRSDSSTKFKGVHWHKRDKVFCARIQHKNKRHELGRFSTAEQAAEAYNNAAKKLHKEYAYLNGGQV